MSEKRPPRLYFDYAATTPVAPGVLRAMRPYFGERFGNPGSLHGYGQEAMRAVDASREAIARGIGADFREIVFAGSATEANNLALRGAVRTWNRTHPGIAPRILVSAIEHESVLETARALEEEGAELTILPVDTHGILNLAALARALDDRTALVSVMYVNNETGAIQPIAKIARIVRDFRKRLKTKSMNAAGDSRFALHATPFFHTDAAQALQFFDCNVSLLEVDYMTFSAHKIYGPKGIGALYVRRANDKKGNSSSLLSRLSPLVTGGGQEFGIRSGTENVPCIAGFAEAARELGEKEPENRRLRSLRDELFRGIRNIYPRAQLNGPRREGERAPHILNVFLPGCPAEEALAACDAKSLAVSSGSACRARSPEPSPVIRAMGFGAHRATQSIRISIGRPTAPADVRAALRIFAIITKKGANS